MCRHRSAQSTATPAGTDVIVVGGGPAGTAIATLVARSGRSVRLFERAEFPRFQIGESLVPAVNGTLERLGVLSELDRLSFPHKHGVQFFSPNGPTRPFYFAEVEDPKLHQTWQVLRSDFDAMLLRTAKRAGVVTATGVEVVETLGAGDVVDGVAIEHADGTSESLRSRVVVDATGQNGLLTRRFGGRQKIDGLENAAVFAHYRGVVRDPGVDAGSTLIYRLDGQAWLWFIPLPDTVSIGLVAPADRVAEFGKSPTEILEQAIAGCPALGQRLTEASRTTVVRAARDVSYRARRDGGPGWLLVGDALGFIDPIYSTGLLLTLLSAELGARAIEARVDNGNDFGGYSTEYQVAFDQFLVLVQAFYREGFHFGRLARNPDYRQGLTDLLTGVVGTPAAIEVTRTIQAVFDGEMVI